METLLNIIKNMTKSAIAIEVEKINGVEDEIAIRGKNLRVKIGPGQIMSHGSAPHGQWQPPPTKFESLGGTLKEKELVSKLLNLDPKTFSPIMKSIEQYQEIDKMSFEEAVGRITTFEERLKSQDEPEAN
ncbi:hypothetical protein E3N88_00057 [Mikania micrantha]|uniref:Uncharacterized protein n=1 Tax=Mikania micrantha TaxID=192012 RepID=A0A5N6PZ14_9ASTR|nr:hypothetical protein E3N88_00057 [Mikania micrantha]